MKKKPENIKQEDWDAVNSPPLSKKTISRMKAVSETHPRTPASVRGPQLTPTKKQLTLRLNGEVVDYFKLKGKAGKQKSMTFSLSMYTHTMKTTLAFNFYMAFGCQGKHHTYRSES